MQFYGVRSIDAMAIDADLFAEVRGAFFLV